MSQESVTKCKIKRTLCQHRFISNEYYKTCVVVVVVVDVWLIPDPRWIDAFVVDRQNTGNRSTPRKVRTDRVLFLGSLSQSASTLLLSCFGLGPWKMVFFTSLINGQTTYRLVLAAREVNALCYIVFARDGIYAKRAYAIAIPSVRLSVCPSVTRVIHAKTVVVRIVQFSPYSSLIPLVFVR